MRGDPRPLAIWMQLDFVRQSRILAVKVAQHITLITKLQSVAALICLSCDERMSFRGGLVGHCRVVPRRHHDEDMTLRSSSHVSQVEPLRQIEPVSTSKRPCLVLCNTNHKTLL